MKKWILSFTSVLALGAVDMPSFADDKSDIKALYVKRAAEFRAKNPDEFFSIYTGVAWNEQVDKKQQVKPRRFVATCNFEGYDIKVTGNSASTKTKTHVVQLFSGARNGKTSKIELFCEGVDILEKSELGWRFKKGTSKRTKLTMDGKPFDPGTLVPPSGGEKKKP